MTKKLELVLLGTLEICQDGVLMTDFKSSKARALLGYLAVTGQAHARPALVGLLWGDMPERKARMNLSQALTTLRRSFGKHLTITRQTVEFNRDSDYWLDVEVFEAAAAEGEIEALQAAVQLYRGDFLDGFYVRQASEFELWVLSQRARLRELALKALHTLAGYYAAQGEAGYEKAIDTVKHLLILEPWQEEAHRQLMHLLALSGQRSAALVQYEHCRRVLIEELGVEPAAETSVLYEQIRDGEFTPLSNQHEITVVRVENSVQQLIGQTISAQASVSTNLPPQPTEFVGRERELDELADLILDKGARQVTIVGPGGIGKTRLALEFAERQLPSKTRSTLRERGLSYRFPNGIYFVSLESLSSSELIMSAVAEAIRYRLDRGEAQLMDYLHSKRMLLIIDNLDHLLDGVEILSRMLKAAPDVHILSTSRENLNLHEEQVFPLQGLEFPEVAQADQAVDYSAGKLFLQAARRRQPDFSMGDAQVESLVLICQLVEGMPLALELAATWIDTLPLSEIATEIQHNFDFLTTEFRDMPARHRSVRAVIDVSWEQLQPVEKTLFSQLSVFRGGFTRKAAAVITGATIQGLSSLVGKSLLRYAKSQDRYYLHELLRQYGGEKLAAQKVEVEEIHDRHSQYYCEWFANQVTAKTLKSVGQKAALEAMNAELENTREAWRWAVQNQRIKRLMYRATSFGMYYAWRGGLLEGERTIRAFISHLTDANASTDANRELLKASLMNWQGYFLSELGDRTKAFDLLIKSQELLRSPLLANSKTKAERAHNLVIKSEAGWWQSFNVRLEQLAQARAWYRDVGHPFGLPFALSYSAHIAIFADQMDEAQQFLEESLELHECSGNELGRAFSLMVMGNLAFTQNNYEKAERLFQKSVEIAKEMEDLSRIAIAMSFLGTAYLYSGQFSQAQRVLKISAEKCYELGLQDRRAAVLFYLGYACLHLGKYDSAARFGSIALPLAQEINFNEVITQAIMLPAASALANGEFLKALQGFEQAAKTLDSERFTRVIYGEDCGQIGLGVALLQHGRMAEAQSIFTTLLQQAVNTHRLDGLLYSIVGFALNSVKRGDAERAVELYSLAASQPFVGNSRWFSDVYGKQIEAASMELPSASVEQARKHGEHRDLWQTADELLREYSNN
jgi:DNA-binding SARP family transcriptional activator/predicted ATPase